MASNTKTIDDHVGEQLSGYIDGELTQQQRQWVELHCDSCAQCARDLRDLRALRKEIGETRLSEVGEDNWREHLNDSTVKATRSIGWLLLIGGFLAIGGIAIFAFVTDPDIELHMKLIIGAIYVGFAGLFFSVLRQRLIERKSDKYKDVEI